ncbi:hypothetical protein [Paenibacillus sp. MMS18-CY102]|uniref:hypothetical protein n=1 Tax=Paenibacillus sp. MMS18-CY102 TaxID=2682849 RepID=UPI00136624ED|nr:hypothetical protein [Paenibacillus sp. MMS18-CY102]MWC27206.1 hypothetical protein [Paenibacillus sp. MMS18-CY102]
MKKWIKYGVITITASSLVLNAAPLTKPQLVEAATIEKTLSSQYVGLKANATLSIRDAQFLMQEKGRVLTFTVNINNNGNSSVDLIDYWLRVKTKNGKSFKAAVIDSQKDITSIPAKSSKYLTYYAVVDSSTKLSDLQFEIIKWDFSVANYERQLGVIKASSKESNKIAAFKDKTMIYGSSKIRSAIKQAFITKDQTNAYITLNFLIENAGLNATDLANMRFYIQTDSNSVYKVSAADLEQASIQPKERKIATLNVKLPIQVASKPLALVVALNDDASKLVLPVGEFTLPALTSAPVTAVGGSRTVYFSGQPVTTSVAPTTIVDQESESTTDKSVSLEFQLINKGSEALKTPDLEFYLKTKSNVNYPLTYTKDESKLIPGIKKALTLTGDIPGNVKVEDCELVVRTAATDKDMGYVVGTYKTTSSEVVKEGTISSTFTYASTYSVKLNGIQRTPMEDNDMLVADIAITNTSKVSKKVPTISGYFLVNGVQIENESKLVALDDTITIGPGETYNYIVYTSIPYTTTIGKIAFVATEPVKDKPAKKLYQFSGQAVNTIPVYQKNMAYSITSTGKHATIQLSRNAIFKGETSNVFYSEFVIQNKESRLANLAKLGAYLKDKNGQIVPVTFATMKEKVMPNGKVLMSAWATLPSGFDQTSYGLFIGQSIETAPVQGSTTTTQSVIIKPVNYQLGKEEAVTNTTLQHLSFASYDLSLQKVRADMLVSGDYNVDGIQLRMNYSLVKDTKYDIVAGEHKVMFEFVNNDRRKAVYTKTFNLTSVEGSQDELLKEGTEIPLSVIFKDTQVQNQLDDHDTYTLNVYDVFQNAKILIGSKKLTWFVAG